MTATQPTLTIGALLYPGFEMLDLFGPLEMFSILGSQLVQINTIAEVAGPVSTAMGSGGFSGPEVQAQYDFSNAPASQLLLVPGGFGTIPALESDPLTEFLRRQAATADIVASVCTGSALLAHAGLLDGRRATSNKQFFALATSQSSNVIWVERARWVADGKFWTSSGVSAGMDMSIAIIEARYGGDVAQQVCDATEYVRDADSSNDPFVEQLNRLAGAMGTKG